MTLRDDAGLVFCAAVWGSTFFLVKDSLAAVDAGVMVSYRFLLAAAVLAPWALFRKRRLALLKESAILAFLLAVLYVTQTVGLATTTASNSGFITGLFVLFVPAFLWAGGRGAPTRMQAAAVGLALAGLWLLTGGPTRFSRGDALTVVSAAAYAGHLLATDRCVRADADSLLLAFHQFWMTGLLSLGWAAAQGAPLSVGSPKAAAVIAFLATIPTVLAFAIQMSAQRRVPPLKVSLIFSLEPVFAAVFAWTLGGEAFHPSGALGGGLIVAAMMMGELSRLPPKGSRAKEILPV